MHDCGPKRAHMGSDKVVYVLSFLRALANQIQVDVGLTGGEPMLYPDFYSVLDQLAPIPLNGRHLLTNGSIRFRSKEKYPHYFESIFVPADRFHGEFIKFRRLRLEDLSYVSRRLIVANQWDIRLKGRAKNLCGLVADIRACNFRYCGPQINFDNDQIRFCADNSHEPNEHNFVPYDTSYLSDPMSLVAKAQNYIDHHSDYHCLTPCMFAKQDEYFRC